MSKLGNKTESDIKNTQIAAGEQKKKKSRGTPFLPGNKFGSKSKKKKEKLSLAEYIKKGSNNGRLMADWNLDLIKALKWVKDDAEIGSDGGGKGVICSYKGIPVTAEMAKSANAWLTDNWIGRAGQRVPEPVKDDRTEDQKMEELKFTLKELGYKLVKITQ